MSKQSNNIPLLSKEQEIILHTIINPLTVIQNPTTIINTAERIRTTKHVWVRECLIPSFKSWKEGLPNKQITWLGDDCIKLARTLTEKAFPALLPGIFGVIKSLGSDNPTVLADGIFEFAKNKLSLFEASLFTFGVIQLLMNDQFAFPDNSL